MGFLSMTNLYQKLETVISGGGAHIRDPGRFIWTRGTPVTTLAAIKAKLQLGSSLVLIRPGCLGSRELGEEGSLSVNKAVQVALLEC